MLSLRQHFFCMATSIQKAPFESLRKESVDLTSKSVAHAVHVKRYAVKGIHRSFRPFSPKF